MTSQQIRLFPDRVRSAFRKLVEMDHLVKERYPGRLAPVVCLPDLNDQAPAAQELFAEMKKKGMVTLSDLLEGKVEHKGRIDVDEIYRLGQAVGIQSQEHGDFPLSPKKVWVRLSDVTKPLQPVDDNKVLWFTSSQLAAKYEKEAQTIRLWFREGFFQKQGYFVERDPTGHCRVGIPRVAHPCAFQGCGFCI